MTDIWKGSKHVIVSKNLYLKEQMDRCGEGEYGTNCLPFHSAFLNDGMCFFAQFTWKQIVVIFFKEVSWRSTCLPVGNRLELESAEENL